ncbi:methyltransferase domain-containing protein [Nonomuraea sp. NPDC048892]|uniref:class I SAM-dependent methyltransferase n=1 Tax=Nonomuraea sp. NPDC048892 TaxID=3154624 RepID=UPI000A7A4026
MTSFNPENTSLIAQHEARLRYLEPMTMNLADHLGPVADGARILDLCCGIGEPALYVARTHPKATVVGVDSDPASLELAEDRARVARLDNVSFETMDMHDLSFATASFDGAISRLGALLFGDMDHGAAELARVLRPGAGYAFAMWSDAVDNPYMRCGIAVAEGIAGSLEAAGLPDIRERVRSRASAHVLSAGLRRAGFASAYTQVTDYMIDVPDFDTVWDYCTTSGPLDDFYAGLDDEALDQARRIVAEQAGARNGAGWRLWFRHRSMYGQR